MKIINQFIKIDVLESIKIKISNFFSWRYIKRIGLINDGFLELIKSGNIFSPLS